MAQSRNAYEKFIELDFDLDEMGQDEGGKAAARADAPDPGTKASSEGAEAEREAPGADPAPNAATKGSLTGAAAFCVIVALAIGGIYSAEMPAEIRYDARGNAIPPAEVRDAMSTTIEYASNSATNFNGKWGEWHKEMAASELAASFRDYSMNIAFLEELIRQSRAVNVFVIHKDEGGDYDISINMGGDREKKAEQHLPYVAAIETAWGGEAAAEPNPWDYAFDKPVWTAYAPIYDKEGDVVAVLGVDYPVPIIRSYPEWNKSDRRWNQHQIVLEENEI